MGNNFEVINGGCGAESKQSEYNRIYKIGKMNEAWERQLDSCVKYIADKYGNETMMCNVEQHDLMKIGLAGVKYFCSWRDVRRENERLGIGTPNSSALNHWLFETMDNIFNMLGGLTLRNFVTTFPIEKTYDGDKYECKDYFFTMNVLNKMECDKPIGRQAISELFWDYENNDLRHLYVEYMSATSALYKEQTGKGIAEQFCEEHGIPTYTVNRDTGIIKDNATGDIKKMKRKSHLQFVK